MYPWDPEGGLGPQYPKGFEFWYGAVVAVVIVLGIIFL